MRRGELLRASDLAGEMGYSRSRIYQLLAAGILPSVREGRAIWIPKSAWQAWLVGLKDQALASVRGGTERSEVGDRPGA